MFAKHPQDAELYSRQAIGAVKAWVDSAGLALAGEKTAAVSKLRKRNYVRIRVRNHFIIYKLAIEYLGVTIDACERDKG